MTNKTTTEIMKRTTKRLQLRNWIAPLMMLGMVQTHAGVTVDQAPLVVQKPLDPNIVLMLDDSGSMSWSVMPDNSSLATTDLNRGYRNPQVNGLYYNPTVTYQPAVRANGTAYPTSSFPNAYTDPFTTTATADLTQDSGSTGGGSFNFGDSINTGTRRNPVYSYAFAFTVQNGTNYTYYHVSTNCGAGFTNCYAPTDTSGTLAPAGMQAGTNIANWYSSYRTRMQMAKTGLTLAFSNLDEGYRFGFASINGNRTSNIPSPYQTFATPTNSSNRLAKVETYGDGSTGTQKAKFWTWLASEYGNNVTPLRSALNAVGSYYQTNQPWQISDTNTTKYACRQSYTILTTDGFWNQSYSGVGNADNTPGPTNTGLNSATYTYPATAPYSDSASNTLADIAMYYWKTDLMSSIDNEVPSNVEDPAFWQHMTTFTVGMGWDPGGISPAGTTVSQIFNWANGGTPISGFSWPTPSTTGTLENIADLAHAAVNGHGGFYSVKNPQQFVTGFSDALKRIAERNGSGASLASNSTKLDTGTMTYQSAYNTGTWKGNLTAYAIDPTTGNIIIPAQWYAASVLPSAANRHIYTFNGSNMVAFSSPGTLSSSEQTALGANSTVQQQMINYLRGDPANEQNNGGTFRNRDTPIGDIVDSQPVYVGAPNPNLFSGQTFTGAATYPVFAAAQTSRTAMIYVASNDGMMHAFDAATGVEVFAYLPGAVITNGLADLANPDYGVTNSVPHKYFNDGELTVADIYAGGAWKTVLVGTTGRGSAKSVYAFDITTPSTPSLIWERSAGDGHTNSGSIGQMPGKPVIALMPNGQWSVLIGNGYNSSSNTAALLQFALTTTSGAFDTAGTLTVTAAGTSTNNGLAAPATWINNPANGASTFAYAGDLLGNVWSFDLTSNTATKLFTAKDSSNLAQPITAGLLLGKDPATQNVWAFFGTGEWLNSTDLTDMQEQTWYGIIVQSGAGQPASLVTNLATSGRSALVQRSIIGEVPSNLTTTPPTLAMRAFTPTPSTNDMVGKSGWYIDLVSTLHGDEGERIVTPNQFQGSLLLGTSRIPQVTDVCNPKGRGWIMALNPFTGTNPDSAFFDTNGDGQFTAADTITVNGVSYPAGGVGFDVVANNPIFVGDTMLVSFDDGTHKNIKTSGGSGTSARVSWREIINE